MQEGLSSQREKRSVQVTTHDKTEGAEDTVCGIVHRIVSRDVTLEIHTHKSQRSSCDNGGSGLLSPVYRVVRKNIDMVMKGAIFSFGII